MINMGATFCHVNTNRRSEYFNPSDTGGIQKWKGATPDLISILIKTIVAINGSNRFVDSKRNERINIEDPRAWIRKYLSAASECREFFSDVRIGMIPIRLISIPIHVPNHLDELMVIRVPVIIMDNIISFHGCNRIKRRKIDLIPLEGYEPTSFKFSLSFYILV